MSFDNPAFAKACNHDVVIPLYILDGLISPIGEAQRWWLHHSLTSLDNGLKKIGLSLCLRQGKALDILEQLVNDYKIESIYWNRCYKPFSITRDTIIKDFFQKAGRRVITFNASLLHEPWKITNQAGQFFKVFTPYWKTCLKELNLPETHPIATKPKNLVVETESLHSWKLLPVRLNWADGFKHYWQPGEAGASKKLAYFIDTNPKGYSTSRDEPSKDSTSKLSPHLHFGEISPWQIWRAVETVKFNKNYDLKSVDRFLAEIGWREFSYYLLFHTPSLPTNNFKPNFDRFPWKNDPAFLKRWQEGKTGYPIVDAGMRELWHTGYMHDRVRMITASFLTKDLFVDWRLGANWFLDTLVDADLASNSASWQWVAGCGADAAPYFRIFNPVLQGEKFDPDGSYVKRWIPELQSVPVQWIHKPWMTPRNKPGFVLGKEYPDPIVDHLEARKKALLYYKMIGKSQHETKD